MNLLHQHAKRPRQLQRKPLLQRQPLLDGNSRMRRIAMWQTIGLMLKMTRRQPKR